MKGEWLRRSEDGTAVIFLHGVLSSSDTCWKNANGTDWPSLLAREASTKDIGIYLFSYRTNLFSGTYRLGDAVDALKEHMRLDNVFDCRRLIFVAHSMGGLITRKLLVEQVTEFRDRKIAIGIFLVASPSLGSNYANLLAPLARLLGHTQADALRFSHNNAWLMDLDKEFTNLKEAGTLRLFGKELVEDVFITFKGLFRTQVVEPFSGARYFGEPFKVPGSDHFSIAKPDSRQAIQHRLLMRFIDGIPMPEAAKLPIERELQLRLTIRFEDCQRAAVPFRTPHKLLALLDMESKFAECCFDAIKVGLGASVREGLSAIITRIEEEERGFGVYIDSIDDDPAIARAAAMARKDDYRLVNERYLLLALLEEKSGTMASLTKAFSKKGWDIQLVKTAAETARYAKLRRRPDDYFSTIEYDNVWEWP